MKEKIDTGGVSPAFSPDAKPGMEREVEEHSKEIAKGTFWGFLGSGAFKLISFAYAIYVAHVVSQNDIGAFSLSIGLMGLFLAWKSFGMPLSLTRYVPYYESRGEWGKARSILKWTYIINVVSGVILTAAVWLSAGWVGGIYGNPALADALCFTAFFLLLDNIFSTNTSFLQSRSDIRMMQFAINMQNLFKLLFTILLFSLYGATLYTLSAAFVLSYLAAVLISFRDVRANLVKIKEGEGSISPHELLHEIIPFGLMLTAISVLWTIIAYADRVVLGYFVSPDRLAIYAFAAAPLALNIMVFPGVVGGIFLPAISRLIGKGDMGHVRSAMATAQRWILFITLPFAVVMVAFASEMLSVFYGKDYAPGRGATVFLCIGLMFSVISYVVQLALAGMRLIALELRIAFAVFFSNVLLCLLLIPPYGIEGAAAASALSFAFSGFLFLHYGKTMIGFSTSPSIYRLLAIGIVVCCLLILAKPAIEGIAELLPNFGGPELAIYISKAEYLLLLGFAVAASLVAFAALAILLRCFEQEDVAMMRKAAKRAFVPERLIALAEKILLAGVEKK